MTHKAVFAAFALATAASAPLNAGVAPSPFNIGDASQLFVDQVLVRETRGVAFTLHPATKHPANPVLKADQPWEGWRVEIYGNVIYDEDENLFKMWYIGENPTILPHYGAYYATSKDGVHWEKPPVGTVKLKGFEKHNVVAEQAIVPCVFKDKGDPDPKRRYKMITYLQKDGGYGTMVSPDGLNWTRYGEKAVCRGADVITGYYDEYRKLYVAFPKIEGLWRGHRRRIFWLTTSTDFRAWSEPKLVITSDLRDDASSLARIESVRPVLDRPDDPNLMRTEFYGVGAYPMESCTLAFPWIFTVNNNARYGNQEGPGELQLAVSRDLENWERPFRVPCVPPGKVGEWDCGFFCSQSRALRVGDEVWLYYTGSNYTHGTPCLYRAENTGRGTKFTGAVGLAIWQLDRFVSVDAPLEGGSLTTVPVVFEGNRLEINARTRPDGRIVVRLLDAAGKPIPGFEESGPITGDSLRHVVTWNGSQDVRSLAGKPVVLKFEMKGAELFAFAFRPS